jgi:hypothetical protein
MYRQIMVGLLSVINCLCFFFLFSLMTTKVHNYLFLFATLLGHVCADTCKLNAPENLKKLYLYVFSWFGVF